MSSRNLDGYLQLLTVYPLLLLLLYCFSQMWLVSEHENDWLSDTTVLES